MLLWFNLQVASLQAELVMVQTQLINSRLAVANAQQQQQQQQHHHHITMLQPAHSNTSSASNNFINMSSFNSSLDLFSETAAPSSQNFEPLQLSQPSHDQLEEDEEESRDPTMAFANQMLHST